MASTKRQGHSRDIVSSLTDHKQRQKALGMSFLIPGGKGWNWQEEDQPHGLGKVIRSCFEPCFAHLQSWHNKAWLSYLTIFLWEWNEIRCGKVLLKILKSHPQVRCYYAMAHPELKSLETYFQTKLLVSGSSHLCVSLASAYLNREMSFLPPTENGLGKKPGIEGGQVVQVATQWPQGCSGCEVEWPCYGHYTHLLPLEQESDKQPGAFASDSHRPGCSVWRNADTISCYRIKTVTPTSSSLTSSFLSTKKKNMY